MKKYRTGGWGNNLIEVVDVEKETSSSVWIKGHRLSKDTTYHKYFDTFYDAHCYLLAKAEKNVDSCRRSLERANGELGNIRGLREEC